MRLFPTPLSPVTYIISHQFSFFLHISHPLCHFFHFSLLFLTLNLIRSHPPPPPFLSAMNTANLSIFQVFSILPSLHRMPVTEKSQLALYFDVFETSLVDKWGIYVHLVFESFAGLSWAMIETRRCGFHFSSLVHPPPF